MRTRTDVSLSALRGAVTPAVLALAVVASSACGGRDGGPNRVIDEYRAALDQQSYADAYELMSSDFRDQYTREEFVRMMNENAREAGETSEQLGRVRSRIEVTAELHYGIDERLALIQEDGQWRIASNPIQFYSQATARDALRSFLRAYRLQRWDVILRFVPNEYRERMDVETIRQQFEGEHKDEIAAVMRTLENHIDTPIIDKGNDARMPYGDRHEVTFVREDGLWKILDFE